MPATVTTFQTLTDDIKAYLDRGRDANDEVVLDQIPRIVNLAERMIATDIKLQGFQRAITQSVAGGVSVIAKPDGWRETVSFAVVEASRRRQLYARSYEYLRAYWPDESETGTPQFYADYGVAHWAIAPTPASAIPVEVMIYQMPELLSDANQTNWLTDEAPDLLLAKSLAEAYRFVKNTERAAEYDAMYGQRVQSFTGQDARKITDRAAQRGRA